jgi:hypothetical protein
MMSGCLLILAQNTCLPVLFKSSMATSVFSDRGKVSYFTPMCKKGRHYNGENYRGVTILSAILKRFEWLVYRGM